MGSFGKQDIDFGLLLLYSSLGKIMLDWCGLIGNYRLVVGSHSCMDFYTQVWSTGGCFHIAIHIISQLMSFIIGVFHCFFEVFEVCWFCCVVAHICLDVALNDFFTYEFGTMADGHDSLDNQGLDSTNHLVATMFMPGHKPDYSALWT